MPLPTSRMRKAGLRVAAGQLCKFCFTQGYLLLALQGGLLNAQPPPSVSTPSGKGGLWAAWVQKHPGKALWTGEKGGQTGGEVLSLPGTNSIYSFTQDHPVAITTGTWCRASCPGPSTTASCFVPCDLDPRPSIPPEPQPIAHQRLGTVLLSARAR